MSYGRVYWTSTIDTPISEHNLNNMDIGIFNNDKAIEKLETLATYPNTSADCIKGNFSITDGATLTVNNGCLTVVSESVNVIDISSDLSGDKVIDNNRLMLARLRVKMDSGSNLSVYFRYITDTDTVYVVPENIISSNLNTSGIGNPSYTISDTEYHDIWCIFKSSTAVTIKGFVVELAPVPKATISNLQLFYSMDRAEGSSLLQTTYQQNLNQGLNVDISQLTQTTYITGE